MANDDDYARECALLSARYPACALAHHLMLGLSLSAPSVSTQIGPYGRYFHQEGAVSEYGLSRDAVEAQRQLRRHAEARMFAMQATMKERFDDSTEAQCRVMDSLEHALSNQQPFHNEASMSTAARVVGAMEVPNDEDAHGYEDDGRISMPLVELLKALHTAIETRGGPQHTKEFFLKLIGDVRRCARHWYVELLRLTDTHFTQNKAVYCSQTFNDIRGWSTAVRRKLFETPLPDDWMSSEDMVEALDTMWRDVNLANRTFNLRQDVEDEEYSKALKATMKVWRKSHVFSSVAEFHAKSLTRLEKNTFVFMERPSSTDASHACNDPRALIDILDLVCRKEGGDLFFEWRGNKVHYPSDAVMLERLKRAQEAMVNISANERGPIAGWYTAANDKVMERKEIFQRFVMSFWLRKCDEMRWRDTRMIIGKPYPERVKSGYVFPVQRAEQRRQLIEEFDRYEKLARRKLFFPTDWSDKDSLAVRRVFKKDPVLILGVSKKDYCNFVLACESDARCEHLILRALAERILGALGSSFMIELGKLYSSVKSWEDDQISSIPRSRPVYVFSDKGPRCPLWDFKPCWSDYDFWARFVLPSKGINTET